MADGEISSRQYSPLTRRTSPWSATLNPPRFALRSQPALVSRTYRGLVIAVATETPDALIKKALRGGWASVFEVV